MGRQTWPGSYRQAIQQRHNNLLVPAGKVVLELAYILLRLQQGLHPRQFSSGEHLGYFMSAYKQTPRV